MSEITKLDYITSSSAGFGSPACATDYLPTRSENSAYNLTETYYFAFNKPENNLSGLIYVWVHPNLAITSAGCMIWQGMKRHHLQAEHFNFQQYLPLPTIEGDTVSVPAAGLTINILQPLQRHEVIYKHEASQTSVHLFTEAVAPPVVRAGDKHFLQPMRFTGELVLNGTSYALDCHVLRDRSYNGIRSEEPAVHPPIAWTAGISTDGATAFNFTGSDDPTRGVLDWADVYPGPDKAMLLDGWIIWDGTLRKIVSMSKWTTRETDHLHTPLSTACEFVDDTGQTHTVSGKTIAAMPWCPWSNMVVQFCLTEWDLNNGTRAYGYFDEVMGGDFVRRARPNSR